MLRMLSVRRKGFTLVELMISIAVIAILAAALLPALARARESARRSNCQKQMKQLGALIEMYVDDDPRGMLPNEVSPHPCWYIPCPPFFPEYLKDAELLICPSDTADPAMFGRLLSTHRGQYGDTRAHAKFKAGDIHPDCMQAESYTYLSTAFANLPSEMYVMIAAMMTAQIMEHYAPLTNEFLMGQVWIPRVWRKTTLYGPGPACTNFASFTTATGYPFAHSGNIERSWLCQMRSGISDWMGEPAPDSGLRSGYVQPSQIVTFWDQMGSVTSGFNHAPAAVNILFMDGHVETQLYDPQNMAAPWPMTPTYAAIVGGYIANLKAKDLPLAKPDCF